MPNTDPSSPSASRVRCYSSLSPLILSRTILWCLLAYYLLEGCVNKSVTRAESLMLLQTEDSALQFSGAWLNWSTEEMTEEKMILVCLWRLSYIVLHSHIKGKKLPFPKNIWEVVWLIEPKFCSSSWFHSSACLQYTLPCIWVQSVLYLCHPWLKDKDVSYHLNFWTGSYTETPAPPLGMLLRGYTMAVIYCSRRKKRNICIQFSISRWHTAFFTLQ